MFGVVIAMVLLESILFGSVFVEWVHKPFPGFIVLENMLVDRPGPGHWTGSEAGIRFPDKVIAVNGQPISALEDFEGIIRSLPIGTSVNYSISRGTQILSFDVRTMEFTWVDLLLRPGIMFFVAWCIFVMGITVFIVKPHTEVSWVFYLCCSLYAIDILNIFDMIQDPSKIGRWIFLLSFQLPSVLLHLSTIFPGKPSWRKKFGFLLAIPYSFSIALAVAMHWIYHGDPFYETLHHWYMSYLAIGALALLISIGIEFFLSRSVLIRTRAKVLLFGATLAFPIPAGTAIIRSFGLYSQGVPTSITVLPLILFPASIAYAIIKHNLFDVDTYIKRTVGYVMMTAIVAGGYFGIHGVVKTAVLDPMLGESSEKVYPLLFALLTVFAFNPISERVQLVVDKLFYRKHYDYKATVASVSDSLTSLLDVQAFLEKVIHTVRSDLFVDRAGVVLLDDRSQSCQSMFRGGRFGGREEIDQADPCLNPQDPLLELLARERKLISKYDVAEAPKYRAIREVCGQRFEELGASLALPLFYHERFAGMLALGYKKSGHFYTREDVDLLGTLSAMTSTAIEQFREKGQKAVLMQLFSKHVSPQVAESLWEQREQFLQGGRPKSQSMIVTAMFTDLQGFSTISEKQTPELLMNWLNAYLDMMTTTVMEHGGVVDDFFGDGVKINFGVPIPRETEDEIRNDAIRTINCALDMARKMIPLNEKMAAEGQQPLRMRIGIYSGPVVAGSLGSADRMKYTTIGDTVNTAARLESFDKDLVIPRLAGSPCRILIGESTLRLVEGMFDVEKVGELSLKGKVQRIGAYCVLGISDRSPIQVTQAVGEANA